MNTPGFTAQASIYRSGRRYTAMTIDSTDSIIGATPAYYPGPESRARCYDAAVACNESLAGCLLTASAVCAVGCIASGPGYPFCLAACEGGVIASCNANYLRCQANNNLSSRCCPKLCGSLADALTDPGSGCCDSGENCVAINDPNSRQGCCPAGQAVCGGNCCGKGEFCCGGACCPGDMFCVNGACTYPSFGPYTPAPPVPPTPPAGPQGCPSGYTKCKDTCCPPDMKCCGYYCDYFCVN
jgi:hypothetical protein